MLRDICQLAANDDDFVGLRFYDGHPLVSFPRGFNLPEFDNDLRKDILHLLAAIQKFSTRHEGDKNTALDGDVELDFPLQSYQFIILDYLRNGYYTEREIRYIEAQRGKINWKRTIQKEQPQLDGDNLVYLNFIVKTNRINNDNLITRIHEYCVYESFLKMGWLYFDSDVLPMKPRIPFNKSLFLSVLTTELGNTFNDEKKRLFKSMINIINECAEETNNDSSTAFGVHRFEYIWENMIDYVFGENNREQYHPKAHWHIIKRDIYNETSDLRPDTIMKLDGKIYILDAKYYKYGVTGIPSHLPSTTSIQKQITYGDYVAKEEFVPKNNIFNAFLMPYCKSEEDDLPYKFVSVGIADWKTYNSDTENYYYILGILIDTKYLITTYAKHNTEEILRLSTLIEESLERYKSN